MGVGAIALESGYSDLTAIGWSDAFDLPSSHPYDMSPPDASLTHHGDRPYLSVVVPVYNGARDLPALLSSLLAQIYPRDRVEYWIVDNQSRDRTLDILQDFLQTAPPSFQIQGLRETTIQSAYAARNVGIRASRGEIVVFTDVDCRPAPDWLVRLVQPFGDRTVGLVAGEVLGLPSRHWLQRYATRRRFLSQRHTLMHPFCPYGQTANLAVRRRVFEEVGLFRPHLATGGDADLCWRAQAGHWVLQFVEQAVVYHRHRTTLTALAQQWHRYGQAHRFLHDLYGIDLMNALTWREVMHRLGTWLLREMPGALWQALTGATDPAIVLDAPLDLLCALARQRGQTQAPLMSECDRPIAPFALQPPLVTSSASPNGDQP